MSNQRDPRFCSLDDADLAKIRVAPLRIESPDFNYKWFPEGRANNKNMVTPFIYGECAFDSIGVALTSVGANSTDQRIYILAWEIDTSTPMFRPASGQAMRTMWDLILMADKARVAVRGMFNWSHLPVHGDQTGATCTAIDGLSFGGAIHDDWKIPSDYSASPPIGEGIHHQKLIVVVGDLGVIGFIGGMDIQKDRIIQDNPKFNKHTVENDPSSPVDARRFLDPPMHDVHLRVQGPITKSLYQIFVERWSDHPDATKHDGKGSIQTVLTNTPNFALPQRFVTPKSSTQLCMVGRTYPNGKKYGMRRGYSFLRTGSGEHSAWNMIAHAIGQAKDYIYIEDQYLISTRVSQALSQKLVNSKLKRIVILTNRIGGAIENELPYSRYLRARFLRDLQKVDAKGLRWSIHVLKGSSDQAILESRGIYVHSKVWIFDDRYAIVGSANCNERGYTHDSECVMGVAEDDIAFPGSRLGFAQRLRMRLWAKHSAVPLVQLVDWRKSLRVWDIPQGASMIERYDPPPDLTYALNGSAPAHIEKILVGVTDPRGD